MGNDKRIFWIADNFVCNSNEAKEIADLMIANNLKCNQDTVKFINDNFEFSGVEDPLTKMLFG